MQAFVKREMRFMPEVRIRESFKVSGRNRDFARDPFATPIVINNFNRLEYLREQLKALWTRGYENIYIIDNASTYEPLLEFYEKENLRVFYLDTNVGYLALWKTGVRSHFDHNYYVYTDPDIVPVEDCPADFMGVFFRVLEGLPIAAKVGFGLKIDDLPEHNPMRKHIIGHESQFWQSPVSEKLYAAAIDTTFALYRPRAAGGWWLPALRSAGEYMARHLSWYENPDNLSEEIVCYNSQCEKSTHWTSLGQRVKAIEAWPPDEDLFPWTTDSAFYASDSGAQEVADG